MIDNKDEIGLIVSVYYKSLEGSKSLQIRPNLANNDFDENNAHHVYLAEKCAKISKLISTDSYR